MTMTITEMYAAGKSLTEILATGVTGPQWNAWERQRASLLARLRNVFGVRGGRHLRVPESRVRGSRQVARTRLRSRKRSACGRRAEGRSGGQVQGSA